MNDLDIEEIVRENIDRTVHMSLATVKDNKPWVCEVHFAYDDDLNLYFMSLQSRRHSLEIAKNPYVAGNIIDKYNLGETVIGVYFEGAAKLLERSGEQSKAFECMKPRLKVSDGALKDTKKEDAYQFYKIDVNNWYVFGKFGGQPSQKYKLEWKGE